MDEDLLEYREARSRKYSGEAVTVIRLSDGRLVVLDWRGHFRGVELPHLRLVDLIEEVLNSPPLDPVEAHKRKKAIWAAEEGESLLKELGL